MSKPKELNFFIETRNWEPGRRLVLGAIGRRLRARARRGLAQLHGASAFPRGPGEDALRSCRTRSSIFLVRDPVSRMISQYIHNYTKRAEHRDLATTLLDPKQDLREPQPLHVPVEQFLPYYPREYIPDSRLRRPARRPDGDARANLPVRRCRDGFTSKKYKEEKHRTADKERLNRFGAWALNNLSRPNYNRMQARAAARQTGRSPGDRRIAPDRARGTVEARRRPLPRVQRRVVRRTGPV